LNVFVNKKDVLDKAAQYIVVCIFIGCYV